MTQKIWTVIKNGKLVKVTFPDEAPKTPTPKEPEKELDWFRMYQPEKGEK